MGVEEIILLDPAGAAIGTAPKAASHHLNTPYHLAFSCYLVNEAGEVLITQRAPGKATFPGAWTNSCCGHPAPGEGLRQAVLRRLNAELSVSAEDLSLILPRFSYRATMDNGLVEHELCPVVRARTTARSAVAPLSLNPAEVAVAEWRSWADCLALAGRPGSSPWYRSQVTQLAPLGGPLEWPTAEPRLVPLATTW